MTKSWVLESARPEEGEAHTDAPRLEPVFIFTWCTLEGEGFSCKKDGLSYLSFLTGISIPFICDFPLGGYTGSPSSICEHHNIDIQCKSSTLIKYIERS